jgi:glycosyltransferase involved in cell wall biosynthesis
MLTDIEKIKDECPLVSIITVVYNGYEVIERTILSVINQSYTNIEYIIIDGGSKDGTIDIINKYKNKISYWISEPDRGISDAFNKGIKVSSGELIGLLNSGDYYESRSVEIIVKDYLLRANSKLKNYFIIHGNVRMVNNSKSKIYKPPAIRTFSYRMPIWHPTVFVSRNVYNYFLFNPEFKIAMDYDLFSRVYSNQGYFCYVNELICNMDVNGISNKQAIKGFYEVMIASRKNLKIRKITSLIYFYRGCIIFSTISFKKKIFNLIRNGQFK